MSGVQEAYGFGVHVVLEAHNMFTPFLDYKSRIKRVNKLIKNLKR